MKAIYQEAEADQWVLVFSIIYIDQVQLPQEIVILLETRLKMIMMNHPK